MQPLASALLEEVYSWPQVAQAPRELAASWLVTVLVKLERPPVALAVAMSEQQVAVSEQRPVATEVEPRPRVACPHVVVEAPERGPVQC